MTEERALEYIENNFDVVEGIVITDAIQKAATGMVFTYYDHVVIHFQLPTNLAPEGWLAYLVQQFTTKYEAEEFFRPFGKYNDYHYRTYFHTSYPSGGETNLSYKIDEGVYKFESEYTD